MRHNLFCALVFFVAMVTWCAGQAFALEQPQPNPNPRPVGPPTSVLLIIADDLGVDVLKFNHNLNTARISTLLANGGRQFFRLPNLSTLVANGISFTNSWASPVCSPTRATIYTGLQPWRHGVGYANHELEDVLSDGTTPTRTIANAICDDTTTRTCALFGKWHLAGGDPDPTEPFSWTPLGRGWDYYAGNLHGELASYTNWTKYTSNTDNTDYDREDVVITYATEDVVVEAKTWIAAQTGMWFATLAFNAPHEPFEPPPTGTYNATTNIGDEKGIYNAMVQSLDYYIGKLWDSSYGADINDKLQDAIIIFVGDNGTPGEIVDNQGRAKGSVYQGGVHVPLIIADGARIVAPGASPAFLASSVLPSTEAHVVNVADLYDTIIGVIGATASPGFGTDSVSLKGYLEDQPRIRMLERRYNFTQTFKGDCPAACEERATISWSWYKLNYQDGGWELFHTFSDPGEQNDLYGVAAHAGAQALLLGAIQGNQRNEDTSGW
jgi:arylsulfatase A-like enzyme